MPSPDQLREGTPAQSQTEGTLKQTMFLLIRIDILLMPKLGKLKKGF